MQCAVCDALGDALSVDHLEGEQMPDAVRALVWRDEDPRTFDLGECPACGRWYCYERHVDNDIYNLIDSSEITRLTAEAAHALIAQRKKYDQEARTAYLARLRKKRGRLGRLTRDQLRVLDYLVRRSFAGGGQNLPDLERDFGLTPEAMAALLAPLEARGIVVRTVSTPLSGGDPRGCTMLRIDHSV